MRDLTNPKLMYLKAGLLLAIGVISTVLLIVDHPEWKTVVLLGLAVWAFARVYYFMFYVVERYADPTYRFAGIASFLMYLLRRPKT